MGHSHNHGNLIIKSVITCILLTTSFMIAEVIGDL